MNMRKMLAAAMAAALLASLSACAGAHQDSANDAETQPLLSPTAPTLAPVEDSPAETEPPAATAAPTETEVPTDTPEDPTAAAPDETDPEPTEAAPTAPAELTFMQNTASDSVLGVNYTIDYPTVSGDPDNDAAYGEMIDHAIARIIGFGDDLVAMGNGDVTLDVNYTVTLNNDEYLSILWSGDYFVEMAAYPVNFVHGLIIDKATMEIVYLADLYNVDEAFGEVVNAQVDALLVPTLAERLGVTETELYDAGVDGNFNYTNHYLPEEDFGTSYTAWLTPDGAAIGVDLLHVLGDYCPVVIPYDTIADYRK